MKILVKPAALLLSLIWVIFCLNGCQETESPGRDSGTVPEGTTAPETGFAVDVSRYVIIRPEKASAACIQAASELKKQIDALAGGSIAIRDDWVADTSDIPEDACEILLGTTNRTESKGLAAELSGMKYAIRLSGFRIVISASSDQLLSYAVDYFVAEYVAPSAGGGTFKLPENFDYTSGEHNSLPIVASGVPQYHIVYPDSANPAIKPEYTKLKNEIDKLIGNQSQTIATDLLSKGGSYDSSKPEILLGGTRHDEVAEAMEQLKADEYGIFAIGNKIVVCGRTRSSSVLAIEKFVEHLKSSVTKDDKGKVSLSLVYERPLIYKNTSYKTDIPEFASGRLSGAYDCGDGVLEMYYTGVTQADYDSYCEAAGKAGFSLTYSHTAASNTFRTYSDGKTRFFASYSAGEGVLRLITEDAAMTSAPVETATYSEVCAPSVTQLALSYTKDNTNGMGYVLQLSDGSFVIYDGGFTADAENILNTLSGLTPAGTTPYIRAWILTHMHGDHYQAFVEFANNYASQIKLDYVVLNVADKYYDVDYNIYTNGKISSALVKLKATRLLKVHAGTVLRFADAEIEILCTHEELYPGVLGLEYTNDTSIVSRVRLGGQTIIFPGDMQTLESNVLVSMYGTYLKSDFVQISHHGSIKYPATLEFYQMVSPTWAFFPGSKSRYAENAGTPENSYLIKRLGAGNIFVADSENRTISLPFGR
ncbi:MAG TPA: hypothetical protein GX011_00500 [Clostridiales bacterium]|nr:hypothetical protein [Clostridiales bacterium]